jgi:hypothetical protein
MSLPPSARPPGRRLSLTAKADVERVRRVQCSVSGAYVDKPRRNEVKNTWMDRLGNFHDKHTHMFVRNPNRTLPTRKEIRAAKMAAKEKNKERKT